MHFSLSEGNHTHTYIHRHTQSMQIFWLILNYLPNPYPQIYEWCPNSGLSWTIALDQKRMHRERRQGKGGGTSLDNIDAIFRAKSSVIKDLSIDLDLLKFGHLWKSCGPCLFILPIWYKIHQCRVRLINKYFIQNILEL